MQYILYYIIRHGHMRVHLGWDTMTIGTVIHGPLTSRIIHLTRNDVSSQDLYSRLTDTSQSAGFSIHNRTHIQLSWPVRLSHMTCVRTNIHGTRQISMSTKPPQHQVIARKPMVKQSSAASMASLLSFCFVFVLLFQPTLWSQCSGPS